jgi:uncharacterized membrane protein
MLALGATILAAIVVILATGTALPDHVAIHFGARGTPNSWASRDGYLALVVAQVVVVPALLLGLKVVLPRWAPRFLKVPNRDYWLAAPRRTAALRRIASYVAILDIAVVVFLTVMHLVIVQANARPSPQLPLGPFVATLVVFIVATAAWSLLVRRAFRIPP